ncbi:MAG: hypothetical protein K2N73_17970 [Lachnospiraceae bacterium]|nr:hypothetical protein [Lachnospiraceae bacterium]
MNNRIYRNRVLAAAAAAALLITGCQSNAQNSAETEALKEQIARLEQQIADLEQKQSVANGASSDTTVPAGDNTQQQPDPSPPHSAVNGDASNQQDISADGMTTYTMEELGSMVEAFVTKANAAAPGGTVSEDMEQFFALKQEEKQIDDLLDRHEDELEYLYKSQSLARDDYKRLERELELLEDKLDSAENQLAYVFGIDD